MYIPHLKKCSVCVCVGVGGGVYVKMTWHTDSTKYQNNLTEKKNIYKKYTQWY